jgi:hypothetical protein
MQVLTAVRSDIFSFLVRAVTELGPKRSTGAQLLAQSAGSHSDAKAGVTDEFKPFQYAGLVRAYRRELRHAH